MRAVLLAACLALAAASAAGAAQPAPWPSPELPLPPGPRFPGAEAALLKSFVGSRAGEALAALGHRPEAAWRLGPNEALVATYVPKQGDLSEWDDETRLTRYWLRGDREAWQKAQFVSKAGASVKGELGALALKDLDADRIPEIVALGSPRGFAKRVGAAIYRRTEPEGNFALAFERRDPGAAFAFSPDVRYSYWERRTGRWVFSKLQFSLGWFTLAPTSP